jgi:hypothetical protein
LVVQPDYNDRALLLDTDQPGGAGHPSGLERLRQCLSSSRYPNPGDRFIFDSRPGDICSIDYDRWVIRLGRDFADPDEQD